MLDESDPDIGEDLEYLENTTVSGVNIAGNSITLSSALAMIFSKVKDQELTWVAKDEMILITTVATSETTDYAFIRSYNVTKLKPMFEEMARLFRLCLTTATVVWVGWRVWRWNGWRWRRIVMVPQPIPGALMQMGGGAVQQGASSTGTATGAAPAGGGDAASANQQPEANMIKNTWQRCLINEIQSLTPDADWISEGGKWERCQSWEID